MSPRRQTFLERIDSERRRQINMPGSEFDGLNSPNEWLALAAHYLFEEVRRGGVSPELDAFEDALVKAAAVISAAFEHVDQMQDHGHLR
jgi:hypothetical protein